MPSPFPGMDPYLEASWGDVQPRLIVYACDALQEVLPASLCARVEERVILETGSDLSDERFSPGVGVVVHPADPEVPRESPGTVATEPMLQLVDQQPLTEAFIEVFDVSNGNAVVTFIEILSPANKTPGDSMDAYLRRQQEICRSDTNLVEIDLLRTGKHVLAVHLD